MWHVAGKHDSRTDSDMTHINIIHFQSQSKKQACFNRACVVTAREGEEKKKKKEAEQLI